MDVAATSSTSPEIQYSVAQKLQNLASSSTTELLNASGLSSGLFSSINTDAATNAASEDLLMRSGPSYLIPLWGNSDLMNQVIAYRQKQQSTATASSNAAQTNLQSLYSQYAATNSVGSTVDTTS